MNGRTEKSLEVERYVDGHIIKYGHPPTYAKIAKRFKISTGSVWNRIKRFRHKMVRNGDLKTKGLDEYKGEFYKKFRKRFKKQGVDNIWAYFEGLVNRVEREKEVAEREGRLDRDEMEGIRKRIKLAGTIGELVKIQEELLK